MVVSQHGDDPGYGRGHPPSPPPGCKTALLMPRRDWNTPTAHTQKPRHAKMHSAARGKGHGKKVRAAKRARNTPVYRPDRRRQQDERPA